MLQIKKLTDPATGLSYLGIGREGAHTAHHYFTSMSWRADSRNLVVATDADPITGYATLAAIDIISGHTIKLREGVWWQSGLVSRDNNYFYAEDSRIYVLNLATNRHALVAEHPAGCPFLEPLSLSADGQWLGVYWHEEGRYTIGTVDTATGSVQAVIRPDFAEPYPIANHAMVNPVYINQIFFAHEGTTEQIPDRIWAVDAKSGEARNLYEQRKLPDGTLGEYVGHEMWSYDGEWLYYVQYPHSPLRTGICRVSREGGDAEFVNGDYRYWHVCPSPDGRYVVADTLLDPGLGSEIVLIDLATRKSRLLCRVSKWDRHPGHPHPSFSPDSTHISFTFVAEHGFLWVGVIELKC
ncbi:hypothetical protein [Paenibacillus sp. GCM10027626]|uniref:hypothetical protein n=1 Tax=Paenibacillus sp. GCM10027626 TaxID=3273411 RepID=UPI003632BCE3